MTSQKFRFRPRFGGIALLVVGVSVALFAGIWLAGLTGTSRTLAFVGSGMGVMLALLYLASPAWRLTVHVDDDALEVTSAKNRRFRLAWTEIRRVVASPETKTCFVDGGDPQRSLIVPGVGAYAPYDIENKAALYDAIIQHTPAAVIETVDFLESADITETKES